MFSLSSWVDLWKAKYTSTQFGSFHFAYIYVPFLQWWDLAAVRPIHGICLLYISMYQDMFQKMYTKQLWIYIRSCIHH